MSGIGAGDSTCAPSSDWGRDTTEAPEHHVRTGADSVFHSLERTAEVGTGGARWQTLNDSGEPQYRGDLYSNGGIAFFLADYYRLTGEARALELGIEGARQRAVLPLLRAWQERGLAPRVPSPIPTRDGALWATFGGTPFAVFPFFPGATPSDWPHWSADVWDELARTVAAIHRATTVLSDVLLPPETFAVSFEADLLHWVSRRRSATPFFSRK